MNIRTSKRLKTIGTICAIFLFISATGLRQTEVITGANPEIIFHTTASSTSGSSSSAGFNLQHAKSLGADIHAKGNGNLKWQGETVDDRGGTLGAYTEVVNIFNETDYTLHEVYDVLVKDHPELLTSGKQPYSCTDVNKHFGFSVEEDKKCTISEIKDLLYQGKLVQKMVSTNEWRNAKGEQVSWPGSHTGLLFYYDGKYFHMKAAGQIRQKDALYTEEQLSEWMGGQEKKFIVYTKTSSQTTSLTKKTSRVGPIDPIDLTLDEKSKQFQMKLNNVSQGCCFVGSNLIAVCDINVSTGGGTDSGTVCLYDRQTGKRFESSAIERVGNHSNSMTFDPTTNQLLIATKGVDVYRVSLNERKIEKETHLDLKGHGIAYDPKANCFIMVSGKTIMKYTREEFYGEKSPSKSYRYSYSLYDAEKAAAQGLGAYNGYAFIPFSNKDSKGNYVSNTIVVYDIENGENVTELQTSYPTEIEDCMFADNGDLYVSDTLGNLFKTGFNAQRDLKGESGWFTLPKLPKLRKFSNFFSFFRNKEAEIIENETVTANNGKTVSKAQLSNFRNVCAGNIGTNNLYRCIDPIIVKKENELAADCANQLLEAHKVATILNVSDDSSSIKSNGYKNSSYYIKLFENGKVFSKSISFHNREGKKFQKQIVNGLKFFIENEGPYCVHCYVGRDRTGFIIMLLECLMGSEYDYIYKDFGKSFENLNLVGRSNSSESSMNEEFSRDLARITNKKAHDPQNPQASDWDEVNFEKCAERYLNEGGMTDKEISILKENLSKCR